MCVRANELSVGCRRFRVDLRLRAFFVFQGEGAIDMICACAYLDRYALCVPRRFYGDSSLFRVGEETRREEKNLEEKSVIMSSLGCVN